MLRKNDAEYIKYLQMGPVESVRARLSTLSALEKEFGPVDEWIGTLRKRKAKSDVVVDGRVYEETWDGTKWVRRLFDLEAHKTSLGIYGET